MHDFVEEGCCFNLSCQKFYCGVLLKSYSFHNSLLVLTVVLKNKRIRVLSKKSNSGPSMSTPKMTHVKNLART